MTEDLDKLSTEESGKLFPIKISEHNPDWKNQFMSEKQTIQKAIGIKNILRIEHIGSTAVLGLWNRTNQHERSLIIQFCRKDEALNSPELT